MYISKLYIDDEVAGSRYVESIRRKMRIPYSIVSGPQAVYDEIASAADPVRRAKSILFLTNNKGAFIRPCPGTRDYTCCGYLILHVGTFCVMDCSYCILQSYFHPPLLQFFVNHQDALNALDEAFKKNQIQRIGTGEFTDSMIWEEWTGLSRILVPRFAAQRQSVLELKTKTTAIDQLRDLNHQRKTIMAWSVNTERMIRSEERRTATLTERLQAAARCESWGYPLAFHFDPMVIYDGSVQEYQAVIELIFSHVSAENIVWISLGTFRFMPDLKPVIQKRFSGSGIVYGEFITGLDGKMRYFKPLRIDFYRKIVAFINKKAPDVLVYFCMEDQEVWEKTIGFTPEERGGLPALLDQSAVRCCDLQVKK